MPENHEIKLGFVVAEFNRDLTWQMELLGKEHAAFLGAKVVKVLYVPGVYDMPLAIKTMAADNEVEAIVTIGSVIEGATDHDQVVVAQATRKITDLALEYNKPIALGIAGPGMTRMEASERIEYSKRAVEAAVKMVRRLKEYRTTEQVIKERKKGLQAR